MKRVVLGAVVVVLLLVVLGVCTWYLGADPTPPPVPTWSPS